jgi:hypothetical protein
MLVQLFSFVTLAAGSTTGLTDSAVTVGAYDASGNEVGAIIFQNYSTWAKVFSENPLSTEYLSYKANTNGTKMWVQANFNGSVNANSISIVTRFSTPASVQLYLAETVAGLSTATPIALTKGTTVSSNTPYTATFTSTSASYCRIVFTEGYGGQFVANGNGINKIFIGTDSGVTPPPIDKTLTIAGGTTVGDILTATLGSGLSTYTTRSWQSSSAQTGTFTNISGAPNTTYTTVASDATKYIRYSVSNGTETINSNVIGPITIPSSGGGGSGGTEPAGDYVTGITLDKLTYGAFDGASFTAATATYLNTTTVPQLFSETGVTTTPGYITLKSTTESIVWLMVDFGSNINIDNVSLLTANGLIKGANLYFSTNKETIDLVSPFIATITNNGTTSSAASATFPAMSARYLKIRVEESYPGQFSKWGSSIKKILVRTTTQTPAQDKSIIAVGNPRVDNTLAAYLGKDLLGYSVNWQISQYEKTDYTNINDATSLTYIPTVNDLGKYIRCSVYNNTEILYSNIFGPIVPANAGSISDRPAGAFTSNGTPTSGTLKSLFRKYNNDSATKVIFPKDTTPTDLWVQVDCGGEVSFNTIKLRSAYTTITAYDLLTSNDGVNYTTTEIIPTFIQTTADKSLYYSKDLLKDTVTARYLKIKVVSTDNDIVKYGIQLVNFEFLTSGPSDTSFSLSGAPAIGHSLVVSHNVASNLSPESRWFVSNNGVNFDLYYTGNELRFTDALKGKYVRLRFVYEKYNSSELCFDDSIVYGPIDYWLDKPVISNLNVTGKYGANFEHGDVINFSYTYTQKANAIEKGTTYYIIANKNEIIKTGEVTASTATTIRYLLTAQDVNKNFKLQITPRFEWENQVIVGDMVETNIGTIGIMTEKPPVIKELTLSGKPWENNTLSAIYIFFDPNGDSEGDTTYKWLISDKNSPTVWTVAKEGTSKHGDILALPLTRAEVTKNIKLVVTPISVKEPKVGLNFETEVYTVATYPVAKNLWIWTAGEVTLNSTLKAIYDYSHYENIEQGATVISWYRNDKKIAEGKTYTVTSSDIGTQIKCGVTPKALREPFDGIEVFSEAVTPKQPAVSNDSDGQKGGGGKFTPKGPTVGLGQNIDMTNTQSKDDNVKKELSDIESSWAKDNILKLLENGMVLGYEDNTFRPNANITRAEAVSLIIKALKQQPTTLILKFDDVSENDWFAQYIQKACDLEIIKNVSNIRPNDFITREELATMVARAFEFVSDDIKLPFSDMKTASEWAISPIGVMYSKGIMKGRPDATFGFKELTTRAEFCTIVVRILENGGY